MPTDILVADIQQRMNKALESFADEIAGVRTGMASTALVDNIMVNCYGAAMPLSQLSTVSTPEPQIIMIQPWDEGLISSVEKAIISSDLGLIPSSDGKILRINVPPLSEERRLDLIKVVRKMAEEGRVVMRGIRRDGNDKVKKLLKDKEVTEDDQHRVENTIQDQTDVSIKKIDALLAKKETDLATI
jgi:ribosome recycling factor